MSFTPADKIVYAFLLARIGYFCWQEGGEYFDKQEDIAKALGMDVQVVRRSVKKLLDCEILKGKKIRYQGRWKWVYTDIAIL